ncbi:MAG TPA: PBP1A family penicillin-binding protein [Polyangiaceae bacterium LLY-WYZ-14_1]|nr:PBP1A family penicillin-binding protein [Polyangiaceae bacterium LLY-WYZ-14_1]
MAERRPRLPRTEPALTPKKPIARVRSGERGPSAAGVAKRAGAVVLALGALGLGALGGAFWWYGRDLPPVDALSEYAPPQTTRVLDRSGRVLGEMFEERRTVVPMSRVPRLLVVSVLAAEDADFYRHEGLDLPGILRAMWAAATTGEVRQGGSTITQQLVKLMLLNPERTLSRKLRELILARRLEQRLTKDEILHLYLSHVNFGHGRYGVQEACRFYFGKNVEELTLAEAALLAGLPQAPGRLSPRSNPAAALERRSFVLDQLADKRETHWPDVTEAMVETARHEPIQLVPASARGQAAPEVMAYVRRLLSELVGEEAARRGGYVVHTTVDLDLQVAAREAIERQLERIDERHDRRGTLPPPPRERRRRAASTRHRRDRDDGPKVIGPEGRGEGAEARPGPPLRLGTTYEATVVGLDDAAGTLRLDVDGHPAIVHLRDEARYNPEGLAPSGFAYEGAEVPVSILQLPPSPDGDDAAAPMDGPAPGRPPAVARLELGPEGAALLLDVATREVLAVVGGYRAAPGFNRAFDARRQPGSTFKPIVYAAALETRRFTPATVVLDAPLVYDEWAPQNYEAWRHEGPIMLRDALARSVNVVAVRLADAVGPGRVAELAGELGFSTPLEPDLSLGLGASEVELDELVNAYATFAAGGRWAPLRLVTRIEGPGGAPIDLPEPPSPKDVLSPALAYLVTSLLESVVDEGTGRRARALRRPVAGKTGTSNDARDAWFVGYTPELAAGVWVGFDDRRPLGRREGGARSALPAWVELMKTATDGRPESEFARPAGLVEEVVDPKTGLLAPEGEEGMAEVFLPGSAPTETARDADVADPTTFFVEQFAAVDGSGAGR